MEILRIGFLKRIFAFKSPQFFARENDALCVDTTEKKKKKTRKSIKNVHHEPSERRPDRDGARGGEKQAHRGAERLQTPEEESRRVIFAVPTDSEEDRAREIVDGGKHEVGVLRVDGSEVRGRGRD